MTEIRLCSYCQRPLPTNASSQKKYCNHSHSQMAWVRRKRAIYYYHHPLIGHNGSWIDRVNVNLSVISGAMMIEDDDILHS